MAFDVTQAADDASRRTNVEPMLVLEIEGVDTIYGARIVGEKVKIGGAVVKIGNFIIGGLVAVQDQSTLLTFEGTTTKISQSIKPDTGQSQSISSMKVALIDKDGEASTLMTPDDTVSPAFDLLGRKAKVWLGFNGTSWKQDFVIVFRGRIDDIESASGKVIFNLAHPDTKKRSEIFSKAETELDGAINASVTTITTDDTTSFLETYSSTPTATADSSTISYYIRVDDEVIQYTAHNGTDFTGCTRGALGTTAATHDDGATVESFYRLQGDAMTLALKLMLSGTNGPFAEDVAIKNIGYVSGTGVVANSLYFAGVDLVRDYGLVTGDFVTVTGASNGANNVSLKAITSIVVDESNSYCVIDGVSFVTETATSAVVDFRSQYDTLGEGIGMDADEVDVAEHERILRLFLSSFNYDFYLKDSIEGKDFIEQQLYNPAGGFGLPRKSQSSVGMHVGPLPGTNIQTLDATNVTNPAQLKIRRSLGINFQNTVTYRFEEQPLEDKFTRIVATTNADSLSRIPVGVKSLNITAKGMRTSLTGDTLANTATARRLRKYKFGAEFIDNVKIFFRNGFRVEVGDIVLVDLASLKITDIQNSGTRTGEARLFQVDNKTIDFKTGQPVLRLVDTNFDKDARYGTISPASEVLSGASTSQFTIQQSYSGVFGVNEFKKWENLIGASIRVRNGDYSVDGSATLSSLSGNVVNLSSSLGFTPSSGHIMELDVYDNQPEDVKLVYAFWSDGSNNFADDGIPYALF